MRLFVAASPPLRDRHALGVHSEFNRWFSLASLTVRPWFARGSITLEWVLTLPRSAASFLTASSRLSRQFLDSSSGVLFYCSPSVQSDNLQPHNAHLHLFAACSSLFPRCSSWATRKPTNQRRKTPRENNSLLGFAAPQEQKCSRSTFLFRDSDFLFWDFAKLPLHGRVDA